MQIPLHRVPLTDPPFDRNDVPGVEHLVSNQRCERRFHVTGLDFFGKTTALGSQTRSMKSW